MAYLSPSACSLLSRAPSRVYVRDRTVFAVFVSRHCRSTWARVCFPPRVVFHDVALLVRVLQCLLTFPNCHVRALLCCQSERTFEDYMNYLPPMEIATTHVTVLTLLGSVFHTK